MQSTQEANASEKSRAEESKSEKTLEMKINSQALRDREVQLVTLSPEVKRDDDDDEFPDNPEIFSLEEDPFFIDQPTNINQTVKNGFFSEQLTESRNLSEPLKDIHLIETKNLDKSAVAIQKIFRGFSVRKKLVKKQGVIERSSEKVLNRKLIFISTEQLSDLLSDIKDSKEKLNFSEILKERGFLPEIKEHAFRSELPLKNMSFEGITFSKCKFDWTSCSDSILKNVVFKNCEIKNLSLMSTKIEDCLFEHCDMQEVMFTGALLENVSFFKTNLCGSSFEDAGLNNCAFKEVVMNSTHFFDARIKNTTISKCNLEDTLFFGNSHQFKIDGTSNNTAKVKRPTTAILVDPENRGETTPKANKKLSHDAHTIPIRITMKVQTTTKDSVNYEVESALSDKEIGSFDKNKPPIPQRLIAKLAEIKDSDCAKILKKAERLASQVDSLFLPGGEDIPPSLYGALFSKKTNCGDDYRRSILEIALIHQSFTKGVPLMAVCRGFQMSNVYFGAQLIQHVSGHNGVYQEFTLSSKEKSLDVMTPKANVSLYSEVFKNSAKDNIISVCCHHQIVDPRFEATEHLETSIRYQGYTKATELKSSGATPMILLQFHPEFYKGGDPDEKSQINIDNSMSKENELFWKILSDSAKAHRIKQMTIQQLKSQPSHKFPKKNKFTAKKISPSQGLSSFFKFFQRSAVTPTIVQ